MSSNKIFSSQQDYANASAPPASLTANTPITYPNLSEPVNESAVLMAKMNKALEKIKDSELSFSKEPTLGDLIIKNSEEYMIISLHRAKVMTEKMAQSKTMYDKFVGEKTKSFRKLINN